MPQATPAERLLARGHYDHPTFGPLQVITAARHWATDPQAWYIGAEQIPEAGRRIILLREPYVYGNRREPVTAWLLAKHDDTVCWFLPGIINTAELGQYDRWTYMPGPPAAWGEETW